VPLSAPVVHHGYEPSDTTVMEPGMTFTVGSSRPLLWSDGWTAVTADRRRTAQFEHTLAVTDTGVEILTLP
ncbi:MAG: type I methionyl aminopeptidase, partial [Acidimicrobiales bacterium]